MTDGPLIVQSDNTMLLEVDHPQADEVRRAIAVSYTHLTLPTNREV